MKNNHNYESVGLGEISNLSMDCQNKGGNYVKGINH